MVLPRPTRNRVDDYMEEEPSTNKMERTLKIIEILTNRDATRDELSITNECNYYYLFTSRFRSFPFLKMKKRGAKMSFKTTTSNNINICVLKLVEQVPLS